MYDQLREKWLKALGDPLLGPQQALLLQETGSPWGWREPLQPRVVNHATDGATTELAGASPAATGRALTVPTQEVLIVEQLDYWYREAAGGSLTTAINSATLELLVDGKGDRRLPKFTLDYFARGDAALRFGKLPLGWVIPRGKQVTLKLVPSGTAGGNFDLYVDLLVRREPLWLMQAAGLLEPGGA